MSALNKSQVHKNAADAKQTSILSQNIQEYKRLHGVSVPINTNYTLDAFTFCPSKKQSTPDGDSSLAAVEDDIDHSKIILVIDSIKTNQKHVSYQTYLDPALLSVSGDSDQEEEEEEDKKKEKTPVYDNSEYVADAGRHFVMYERRDAKTVLNRSPTGSTRYFGLMYAKSLPVLSDDQKIICMPRFAEGLIDMFDCSSAEFWVDREPLSIDESTIGENAMQKFVGSLKLSNADSVGGEPFEAANFQTVTFSDGNQYASVLFKDSIMFYDLAPLYKQNDINSSQCENTIQPIESWQDVNRTYDRILGQWINKVDLSKSWIILQSRQYSQIHLLTLQDLVATKAKHKVLNKATQKRIMGGNFIDCHHKVRFKVSQQNIENAELFWCLVQVNFTQDGSKACIQTLNETCMIGLDETDPETYLKIMDVSYLEGRRVQIFDRGDGNMLFCECTGQKIVFSSDKIQEPANDFSQTWLRCSGNVGNIDVREAFEFTRNGVKVFRVIAIRDHEELMCWEVLDGSHGKKHFLSVNSAKLQAFRWPFFAYQSGQTELIINPLAQPEYAVHHKLDDLDDGRIEHMTFSHDGNLFVMVYTKTEEIHYCLQIKEDFNHRTRNGDLSDFKPAKIVSRMDRNLKTAHSAYEMFVCEQEVGHAHLIFIMEQKKDRWRLLILQNGKPPEVKRFYQTLKSIQNISHRNYIIHEAGVDHVRLLTLDYDGGSTFYEDRVIFRENSHEIVKILADKGKLFALCKAGDAFRLKCFKLEDQVLQLTGQIDNVERTHPLFVSEFQQAFLINDNILVVNDEKLIKIYDGTDEQLQGGSPNPNSTVTPCNLQTYFNYQANDEEEEEGRYTPYRNQRNCLKFNRFLMVFSYPESCRTKRAHIVPYIGHNYIKLNCYSCKNMFTWLQKVELEQPKQQQEPSLRMKQLLRGSKIQSNFSGVFTSQVTHIFQFNQEKWRLQEFDLAGVIKRCTEFKEEFAGEQVLAVSDQRMGYLVTPEGTEYLEQLKIKRITMDHKCELIQQVNTRQIHFQLPGYFDCKGEYNLFEVMCNLKEKVDCSFRFKFNCSETNEIAIACVYTDGNILACFIISGNDQKAYPLFVQDTEHNAVFKELLEQVSSSKQSNLSTSMLNTAFEEDDTYLIKDILNEHFVQIVDFAISDQKIILWSKVHILYANLDNIRNENASNIDLQLSKSDFEIMQYEVVKKKRLPNSQRLSLLGRRASFFNTPANDSNENQKTIESLQDHIDQIYCRSKVKKDSTGTELSDILIKISHKASRVYLLQFNLERNQEVTWIDCSQNTKVFFNADNDFMVVDPEVGIVNIRTKEVLHEYHTQRNGVVDDMQTYDISQGNRLVQTEHAQYLICPNLMIMQYSLLSVIQRFQAPAFDEQMSQFYAEDYYKLSGLTQAHKLVQNSQLLERLLDDYWRQYPISLTTVLVKRDSQTDLSNGQPDILEVLMTLSSDKLISKIILRLSQLPFQFSFKLMIPKLYKLFKNANLSEYLNAWLQQTNQMAMTKVLYTGMKTGVNLLPQDYSYLTKNFFLKYSNPETSDLSESFIFGSRTNDDQYFNSKVALKSEEEDYSNAKQLKQVDIHMLKFDWLTLDRNGLKFLSRMTKPECLVLFQTPALRHMTIYLWDTCRSFFIYQYFLPFLLLCVVPLILICGLTDSTVQGGYEGVSDSPPVTQVLFLYLSLITFAIGTCMVIYEEVLEIVTIRNLKKYASDGHNYFQWLIIISNLTLICLMLKLRHSCVEWPLEGEEAQDSLANKVRMVQIFTIIAQGRELAWRIMIFDKFAIFFQQMKEIVLDSLPLASMLAFIILAQTILFWVLDSNSDEPRYHGYDGFANCFVDSYMLALGEFKIAENFTDNSHNILVFWFIFFAGTILTLLIILNMVIALMSSTFERVQNETESHILRAKLFKITSNFFRLKNSIKKQLKATRYVLVVDVDPRVQQPTDIQFENMEERMSCRLTEMEQNIERVRETLVTNSLAQVAMNDRICLMEHGIAGLQAGIEKNAQNQQMLYDKLCDGEKDQ